MIPATINCCYAFCLPVGTPCNAMVLTAGKIKTSFMVFTELLLNSSTRDTNIITFVLIIVDEGWISDEYFHPSHCLFDYGQHRRFGFPLERLSRLDHFDCVHNNRNDFIFRQRTVHCCNGKSEICSLDLRCAWHQQQFTIIRL